jgi:serine/threonine-protein kinase
LESVARDVLDTRAAMVAEIESSASHHTTHDHVASVLNAKATLHGPATGIALAPGSGSPGTPRSNRPLPYPTDGPPVTQPSSISVSTGMGTKASDGRKTAILVLASVVFSASVLVGALVYRRTTKKAASDVVPEPTSSVSTIARDDVVGVDAGTTTIAPPAAAAATTAPTQPTTPSSTPSAVSMPAASSTVVKVPPRPKPKPTEKPVVTPPDECVTPYWYDAQGVKHYKPQCLGK